MRAPTPSWASACSRRLYGVSTLDGFGASRRAELIACALLFDYLALTQAGGAARLRSAAALGARRLSSPSIPPPAPASRSRRSSRGQRQGSLVAADRPHRDGSRRAPSCSAALAVRRATPPRSTRRLDAVAFFLDALRTPRVRARRPEARQRPRARAHAPRRCAAAARVTLRRCAACLARRRADLRRSFEPGPAACRRSPPPAPPCSWRTSRGLPPSPARSASALARDLPVPGPRRRLHCARAMIPSSMRPAPCKEDARGVIARLEAEYCAARPAFPACGSSTTTCWAFSSR